MHADKSPGTPNSAQVSSRTESTVEVIEVLEEQLTVTKQVVDSGGGLRLRKIVHANVVDVVEPLALETLDVKRISINREVAGPIGVRYEGDTTVFSILEERLVTRKQLVLVEEIHVTKLSQVDRTTNHVTLRREEIIIERQDRESGEWSIVDANTLQPTSS